MTLREGEIIGRLGDDPEIRQVGGDPVTSVGVATETYGDDDPVWVRLELWGQTAEAFAEHASQGSYIRAEGQLELDEWDGGAKLKVVGRDSSAWTFMDTGGGDSQGGQSGPGPAPQSGGDGADEPFDNSDVPF
jgi:single-stranded DNA-binding protein